jgi:hypothetical protein
MEWVRHIEDGVVIGWRHVTLGSGREYIFCLGFDFLLPSFSRVKYREKDMFPKDPDMKLMSLRFGEIWARTNRWFEIGRVKSTCCVSLLERRGVRDGSRQDRCGGVSIGLWMKLCAVDLEGISNVKGQSSWCLVLGWIQMDLRKDYVVLFWSGFQMDGKKVDVSLLWSRFQTDDTETNVSLLQRGFQTPMQSCDVALFCGVRNEYPQWYVSLSWALFRNGNKSFHGACFWFGFTNPQDTNACRPSWCGIQVHTVVTDVWLLWHGSQIVFPEFHVALFCCVQNQAPISSCGALLGRFSK